MRRVFYLFLLLLFVILFVKSCVKQDIPETYGKYNNVTSASDIIYPSENVNVSIDGVDYLQSQSPIGDFGGELIITTIGEGPKTFNPCNTKDATSSSMTGLMYDGLLTTDAISGKVVPLLAKSFEVNGNEYTIHLRKGLK